MAATTTAAYTPNPQALPDYLSYSTYVTNIGGVAYTTEAVVEVAQTYYGPSIPLGEGWTYGGSSSPASTNAASPSTSSSSASSPSSSAASSAATATSSTSRLSSSETASTNSLTSLASFSPESSTSSTSSPTSSRTAGIANDAAQSGLSKVGTILLSVLLPLAFVASIGLCLFAAYRKRKRRRIGTPALAVLGDDGFVQRGYPGETKARGNGGRKRIGFWPFGLGRKGPKGLIPNPNTIIGARYGLISTKNSGNRALRVRDEADMQRDMSATPEPRIVAEDGYDPVSLGGHQDRDWSDERQEYLHDVDERSDENHQRYGAFGQKSIRHLRNDPAAIEDDIVNSYLARTPAFSNEGSFTNDPALSPASMQTGPVETSPSMGTDQSSPSAAQAASPGLGRRGTAGKWSMGAGIGLGMPRRAGSSQSQNQLRRRTPGRIASQHRPDSAEDMAVDGLQDSSRSGHLPLESPRTSTSGSIGASGRGWKWLNGLGIAHVFGATNPEARNDAVDTSRWSQARVPSTNIWGDRSRQTGEYQPTPRNEDQYQDALDDSSIRDPRQGTIRLLESYESAPTANDNGDGTSLPFLPDTAETSRNAQVDSKSMPYGNRSFEERLNDSSASDASFARNQDRESTGFRDAVLAALGFSSGNARPDGGITGSPPRVSMESGHLSPAPPGFGNTPGNHASRNAQPELFSLPPTNTAYSLDRLASVGLGLSYPANESLSQMSHPSHSDGWDAIYRHQGTGLDLDSDMLDFSSPSRMSNSRSGSGSVFASAHTPTSTNRSPAMMSTGPMPHSEQFHYETDEPVPEIPNDKLAEPIWNPEDQREIALSSTAFSSPKSSNSADRNAPAFNMDLNRESSTKVSTAQAAPSNFPLPPVRQVATSPRGLRPRPSAGTLHQVVESVPKPNASHAFEERTDEAVPAATSNESVPSPGRSTLISPTTTVFRQPDLFSPNSVISTNTFGGDAAGTSVRAPAALTSPIFDDVSTERRSTRTDLGVRSRMSHLFADADHRTSVMSSTEPLTGNTFSSFREQQNHGGISESANRVDDHATKGAFRNGGNANDPMDRWSVSSFPGQPIVPSEVYRQAVSSEISTNGAAFNSPRKSGKSRPLPIPAPISTRSPIEVQSEYGTATGYMEDRATNLAMGDVSATAKSAVLVRPLSYLAPPSSQAGSFFTAQSSSSSARSAQSHNDANSTPAHSPLDVDSIREDANGAENEHDLQQLLPQERSSATPSGRRPKFSNTSASSAMAVPILQPLDERVEDALEDGDELDRALTRSQSLSAVHGRRSMPQLLPTKQALGLANK